MADDVRDLLDDSDERADEELDAFLGDDPLTEDILDAASDASPPTTVGYVEPLMDMPPNKATLECLRGPCAYHWHLTSRMPAPGRDDLDIRVASNRHCTYGEGIVLNSKNVFRCTRWWPSALNFVPEFMRDALRPKLRAFVEARLRREGYDMSWRVWPDDVWELTDRPEYRDAAGLAGDRRPPGVSDFQRKARTQRRMAVEAAKKGNGVTK